MSEDVAIVSGMTSERVIGRGNELPWHIGDDLKNFKRLTTGGTIIMGLNTYRSINRPLPDRHNIVLSHKPVEIEGVEVCSSLEQALERAQKLGKKTFIVGGASVYAQALPLVNTMYLSFIKKNYEGDVLFPEYDQSEWKQEDSKEFDEFTFVKLKRKATT